MIVRVKNDEVVKDLSVMAEKIREQILQTGYGEQHEPCYIGYSRTNPLAGGKQSRDPQITCMKEAKR